MRIVGIRGNGGAVQVAARSEDGAQVTVLAPLENSWAGVQLVPPAPERTWPPPQPLAGLGGSPSVRA